LTLKALTYDADWNLLNSPVAGAVIYVDGKATSSKTDAEGKVTLSFDKAGTYTVSAKSDSQTLVPPVCIVTSNGKTASSASKTQGSASADGTYTVMPGDCLWTICQKIYGNGTKWGELFACNTDILTDPRLIYPGQVLKLF
jgi:nucleoid-associated protein YgaU